MVANNLDAVVAVIMFLSSFSCQAPSLRWVFLSLSINQCRDAAALATSGSLIIDYIDWLMERQDGQVFAAIVAVITALSPFQMNMCPAKVEVRVYQG